MSESDGLKDASFFLHTAVLPIFKKMYMIAPVKCYNFNVEYLIALKSV